MKSPMKQDTRSVRKEGREGYRREQQRAKRKVPASQWCWYWYSISMASLRGENTESMTFNRQKAVMFPRAQRDEGVCEKDGEHKGYRSKHIEAEEQSGFLSTVFFGRIGLKGNALNSTKNLLTSVLLQETYRTCVTMKGRPDHRKHGNEINKCSNIDTTKR